MKALENSANDCYSLLNLQLQRDVQVENGVHKISAGTANLFGVS
jgi:hypothetical protein